jgi:acetylornithine deacetylase/succinyl-diaminopimelate desuccinylase-like protein
MDLVELTKKLISIESITGNEKEIAEFIASELDMENTEMQGVEGFGPNVIAKNIPNPNKPFILLNCHMDTVGIVQGWGTDPFKAKIEGNKMLGLGACDMKAGIAVAMDVFNKAVQDGKNAIFTAVSDEEGNSTGAHVHLEKILKSELKEQIKESLCLILENTQETVRLGARGRYVIEIELTGRSAHGATPECGTNAIEDAAKIVKAINKLPINSHPKLGAGSICILKIIGGGEFLSVPDKCMIRVDRHTVLGDSKEQIMDDFNKTIEKLGLKSTYELSWMKRPTPFLEPYILEEDSLWTQRFINSYLEFYKKEPVITYGKSVGDFNVFGKAMPTIVFGPKGENVHGPNECVYIDSLTRCRDFYNHFIEGI